MLKVRNTIADLKPEELDIVLKRDQSVTLPASTTPEVADCVTLRDFIARIEFNPDDTLQDLYNEMIDYGLEWPFRVLYVSVEIRASRQYELAALPETVDGIVDGRCFADDIDPRFILDTACAELARQVYFNRKFEMDHQIEDDEARELVPWD